MKLYCEAYKNKHSFIYLFIYYEDSLPDLYYTLPCQTIMRLEKIGIRSVFRIRNAEDVVSGSGIRNKQKKTYGPSTLAVPYLGD